MSNSSLFRRVLVFVYLYHHRCDANNMTITSIFLKHDTEKLVNCVMKIVLYNVPNTPTIIINENPFEYHIKEAFEFHDELTKEIIDNNIPRLLINTLDIQEMYTYKRQAISIKYIFECEQILKMNLDVLDEHKKHLVILYNISTQDCDPIFLNIGQSLSMYEITFIAKEKEKDYEMLTFIPQINISTCKLSLNVAPITIASCNSPETLEMVFPLKKPQNLMGCPFKVGMASLFPFSTIENKESLKTLDHIEKIKGSDYEILKIMAEYFNFTISFHFIFRREENPKVEVSFLTFLLEGNLDACAGGLYRIYGDVVEYSGVYGRQAVVWIYTVNRMARSWQNLIAKVTGLYMFILFYFCFCLIWYLFGFIDKQEISFGDILLYGWGALIGTSGLRNANSLKQKILNVFYLILCMHLSAYLSIQIYSFLTIVNPPVVYKTNAEIYESGLKSYLVPDTKYFVNDKQYEMYANTSMDCTSFLDCEEKCLNNNGITVVIDGQFALLQSETAVNDEARTLKVSENLLIVYHEMLFRKNISIIKNFQKVLVRLNEAGIADRLYHEAIGILAEAKGQSASKNIMSYSYSCEKGCSITLAQSAGLFYMWFIGCVLSFITFLIEITYRRQHVIKEFVDA